MPQWDNMHKHSIKIALYKKVNNYELKKQAIKDNSRIMDRLIHTDSHCWMVFALILATPDSFVYVAVHTALHSCTGGCSILVAQEI